MSSRAGYADFFPAAPSVIAKRKAEAAQAAKQQKVRVRNDEYDRDISGALSAASTVSSVSVTTSASHLAAQLTPATSTSSPPEVNTPATVVKPEKPRGESYREPPLQATIPTPKATPPAVAKPENAQRDCRIIHDPFFEKDRTLRNGPCTFRYDGEGVLLPIEDPRKDVPDYTKGPKTGKRVVRTSLQRLHWKWDSHYIGPGPPSQICISNLSTLTTESEILMHFRAFGEIANFELKVDPTTGGSLGVCSITYRDSKTTKMLGHQAAKTAVRNGNNLKMGMQSIRVSLDRDGLKCAKYVHHHLDVKRKQQEAARRKEDEQATRKRPPPPSSPRVREVDAPVPFANLRGPVPPRRDRSLARDPDSRWSKPNPPGYRAFDHLGRRPAVYINSQYIPGELRFCKHLYGRLKNFGVEDILCDPDGFYVVFETLRGLENCFRMCNGDRLFSYQMRMKAFPRGNPNAKSDSRSPSPAPKKSKKLERINVVKETTQDVLKDLRVALLGDVRKRIADPKVYDLLEPARLAKRRKMEQSKAENADSASASAANTPPLSAVSKPFIHVDSRPLQKLNALPSFKKRKPKRQETPASDASPMPNGSRSKGSEDARPLAHRLNRYDLDGSDDESTTTELQLASRDSISRGLSMDIGDDEAADIRNRKRKRSLGARTPSRLKEELSTDDDDDESNDMVYDGAKEDRMDVGDGMNRKSVDGGPNGYDYDRATARAVKKPKNAGEMEISRSSSEEERLGTAEKSQRAKDLEDELLDLVGDDDDESVPVKQPLHDQAAPPVEPADKMDVDEPAPEMVKSDLTWTHSTFDKPRPTVEDDREMIIDLDGLQSIVMDDEDFKFLKMSLKDEVPENIGNVHLWSCKLKEVKAANREGKRGVVHTTEKIEGFYRPNSSGCARTEGVRKIPEAEKSMYLPHRLAVAAKRANAPTQASPTAPSRTTATKPVSSSRENRVNNRRLVQELNNQKQILCGDADVMRFNQLKKRKKPVRFARSAIHNWGLYAMENISANDMIIEYVGEIVRQQVADMRERKYMKSGIGSSYLFRIDENTVIDATKKGGIARFINHSCTPNCTAKIIKVEGSKRIVIYAMRDIKENEELTYDYKFERELDSDERIPCLCGSSGCKGFLN